MATSRIWLALGLLATLLVAFASAAGVFLTHYTYARETTSWTAQGVGQDWVNLLLVVPALLGTAVLSARGSTRALAIWQGLLIYVVYSYLLYAFFIHFNRLFLVYVAALGCASYALIGSAATMPPAAAPHRAPRFAAWTLIVSALLFALMWLAELVPATLRDTAPASLAEVGLIVNPVHVLDLALVLPAMLISGILLQRRHPLGLRLAPPILGFAVVMGVAIEAMFFAMSRRGLPAPAAPAIVMALVIVAAAAACGQVLALQPRSVAVRDVNTETPHGIAAW